MHPLTLAGLKKADATIKRMRKADARRAEKLREKAQQMLEEASELADRASATWRECDVYKAKRDEIEDGAYWAARKLIGTLPRDADGNYTTPAPMWDVTYKGEHVGQFQGEERCDVLRVVCPHDDKRDRNWSDFEVERVAS